MRILVTGGAGFVGSHVVDRLIRDGHFVVVVDDFNDFYPPKFKEENISAHRAHKSFKLYRGDVSDFKFLSGVFEKEEKFDAIIHLAARAGVRKSIENPALYCRTNIDGTLNLLELAKIYGVKDFIFASSSSVYGKSSKVPFEEEDPADRPISPYAATKRAAELLMHSYHHLFGLNCTALRFFTVYGERGRPDMAPYLFTEAIFKGDAIVQFGDGNTERDYTYVGDIVDGIAGCLGKQFGYEVVNLGGNQPVPLKKFIGTLENITGIKANIVQKPMQAGDVTVTFANISKAKRLLGWEPKVHLEEGLTRFVDWYRKNRLGR